MRLYRNIGAFGSSNRLIATAIVVLALLLAAASLRAQQLSAAEIEARDLLANGLSEWVQEFHPRHRERAANEGLVAFTLREGILHADGALGNVGFLRHKQTFCNFEFETEFRAPEGTNNGVCFRAPAYDQKTPAHTGYELQIYLRDAAEPISATGAFYSVAPPLAKISLEPNRWHKARIIARGPRIQAWINGTLVQDFDQSREEATRDRPLCGYISVQNHGGDTDFRHMRVTALP